MAGHTAELVPGAHGAPATISERGTLEFEVLPHDDAIKELRCELYRDAAAFEEHRDAASIARFREEASGMFLGMRA